VTRLDWLEQRARSAGARPALELHGDPAEAFSYDQLWRQAQAGGQALHAAGVRPGDRVALLSESRPRWALALLAIWQAGAVGVPLDPRLEEAELQGVLRDARPRLVLASAGYLALAQRLADGAAVHSIEAGAAWPDGAAEPTAPPPAPSSALTPGPSSALASAPGPGAPTGDTALVVYTSGTGGQPKGVMLSHANLAFQVHTGAQLFGVDARTAAVSVLPLNHIFELTVGLLAVLHAGGRVRYCSSLLPADIAAAMQAQRVTAMAVVPLFLTLLQRGILRQVRQGPRLRRAAFATAWALARALPWLPVRRRLFAGLHRRFGGALRFFISGGAPVPADVERFFTTIGIEVYQGYGLTEASPVVSTNHPGANRRGTVGRPLPGVAVRCVPVAGDRGTAELQTRGPHVMQGYLGRPDLTAAAIDAEGWLHTGDLGQVDGDGFVTIRGRNDNLVVLGSGKKVSAEEVEEHLAREPAFKDVAVFGRAARQGTLRGTDEVCAVVVPDAALLSGADGTGGAGGLHARVAEAVRRRSTALAAFKRPTRVVVHLDDFPKTASRKVRRPQLAAWLDTVDANDERSAG
jgi:long-chain acyl-CoA synthetase